MRSPLSLRNWFVFILINILVAAATTFIVVRMLTQSASRPDPAVVSAGVQAAPANAPVLTTQPVPTQALAAPATSEATQQPVAASSPQTQTQTQTQLQPTTKPVTSTSVTAAPAAKANVRISTVVFPNQRSREAVVIVNEGDQVDMTGWTLSNPRGQTYTFGNVLLFKDSFINLHSSVK